MNDWTLIIAILLPVVFAIPALAAGTGAKRWPSAMALTGTALNFILCALLYGRKAVFFAPWGGFGIDFSLKLYAFNGLILLVAAGFRCCAPCIARLSSKKSPYPAGFTRTCC